MRFDAILLKVFFGGMVLMQTSCSGSAARDLIDQEIVAAVEHEPFGMSAEGKAISAFTLTNRNGLKAKIINYGATLTELFVPDREGKFADVTLGFDNLAGYLARHPYFGCITGRVANRISKGKFVLNGREFTLATNNGANHLHGGLKGLDTKVWDAEPLNDQEGPAVRFTLRSPDGDEGFPGNLALEVFYTLTNDDQLRIEYFAKSDQDTPVNLTNHAYWNLAGHDKGSIENHILEIRSSLYTPVDESSIPTGEILSVRGTPMDFSSAAEIGSRINDLGNKPPGYDHNYVLQKREPGTLSHAATLSEPKSGRVMELWTTEPGVQLYTANYLDGKVSGKAGVVYKQHGAVCLEAQHFPDSVNHAHFPSVILKAGEIYRQTTVHKFYAR